MADYDREAFKLKMEQGLSRKQIAEKLGKTERQIKSALHRENRRLLRETAPFVTVEKLGVNDLRELIYTEMIRGIPRIALKQKYSISEEILSAILKDLKDEGILFDEFAGELKLRKIVIPTDENVHDAGWEGNTVIRFGLCGDKQFNSKYTQITHMNSLYDIFVREGIKTVYDLGDIDEGEQMRKGHQYECYNQGADDHTDEIVKNHPYRKGLKTYFITGNHDHSLIKLAGFDIGTAVSNRRDDLIYLGPDYATVSLTPKCILELRHPIDATAYAISYKCQKMIEAISGGEKPNILAVGHYHKIDYLFYRNVHCFQTGCLQAQTPWMRGRGIAAMMGGWIIELEVDKKGEIIRVKQEFFPFYYAIKNDYKRYR